VKFGIFIYDGVEPIDLATYGVLSMARRVAPAIEIVTIAPAAGVVNLSNGLRVIADHGIDDAPRCDVLVITGGPGWEEQSRSAATVAFLRAQPAATRIVSVCTGAMILAAAGMLDGHKATTKREVRPPESSPLELMRQRYPAIEAQAASVVDCGTLTTGGGVSLWTGDPQGITYFQPGGIPVTAAGFPAGEQGQPVAWWVQYAASGQGPEQIRVFVVCAATG